MFRNGRITLNAALVACKTEAHLWSVLSVGIFGIRQWLADERSASVHGRAGSAAGGLSRVDKKAAGLCGWKWVDGENGQPGRTVSGSSANTVCSIHYD